MKLSGFRWLFSLRPHSDTKLPVDALGPVGRVVTFGLTVKMLTKSDPSGPPPSWRQASGDGDVPTVGPYCEWSCPAGPPDSHSPAAVSTSGEPAASDACCGPYIQPRTATADRTVTIDATSHRGSGLGAAPCSRSGVSSLILPTSRSIDVSAYLRRPGR